MRRKQQIQALQQELALLRQTVDSGKELAALAADAAVRLGVLAPADRDRIRGLLARLGFDLTPPVPVTRLLQEVGKDKKSEEGVLRVVFPTGIGGCEVRPMTRDGFAALFA